MDPSQIRETLSRYYDNVSTTEQGLIRSLQTVKGRPLAIHYYDATGAILRPCFDIGEYQQVIIAKDYFANENSLQWNFYLHFLCNKDELNSLLTEEQQQRVLRDTLFARKSIEAIDDLEHCLSSIAIPVESQQQPTGDLSVLWVNRLRKHELDGAFMTHESYAKIVRSYIAGHPIVDPKETLPIASLPEVPILEQLRRLELRSFRSYPIAAEYNLRPVTLINGVNGTGKTSLLEAIEFWVCGKTMRTSQEDNSKYNIAVQAIDSDNLQSVSVTNNALFRSRDLSWYGNHYAKGNYLADSFNRFNFYDTDAAVRFSERMQRTNILTSLTALVAGPTVNILEERIKSLLGLFKAESSPRIRELRTLRVEVAQVRSQLSTATSDPRAAEKTLQDCMQELLSYGWRLTDTTMSEAKDIGYVISRGAAAVNEITELTYFIADPSPGAVGREAAGLLTLVQEVTSKEQVRAGIQNTLQETKRMLESTTVLKANLTRMLDYLLNPYVELILSCDEEIDTINRRILSLEELSRLVTEQLLRRLLENQSTFSATKDKVTLLRSEAISSLQSANDLIAGMNSQLENRQCIITEIRQLAQILVESHSDLDSCPVCSAKYTREELLEHLKSPLPGADAQRDGDLMQLLKNREEYTNTIKECEKELQILEALWQMATRGGQLSQKSDSTLSDLANSGLALVESLSELHERHAELSSVRNSFAAQSLTASEYSRLLKATRCLTASSQGSTELSAVQQELATAASQLEELIAQAFGLQANIDSMDKDIEQACAPFISQHTTIQKRNAELQRCLELMDQVRKVIDWPDEEKLSSLRYKVNIASDLHKQLEAQLHSLYEAESLRKHLENEAKQLQNRIDILAPEVTQCEKAVGVLEDIIISNSSSKHVAGFLNHNVKRISDIFCAIHSPREFTGLEYDEASNQMILKRVRNSTIADPTTISSGQRSALALSVFMALHFSAPKAPRFLLFDDPVAHVDDLNILSFFDYLRAVALPASRQIIFATANHKIAELFRRKFDFLGEDYEKIALERFE